MSTQKSSRQRKWWAASTPASDIPAVQHYEDDRADRLQYKIIDGFARFVSSPWCIYLHLAAFVAWIGMCLWASFSWDRPPSFDILALLVSLEAVFFSTFVLIRQRRADTVAQHVANEHWEMVNKLYEQNCTLIARTAGDPTNGESFGSDRRQE
jgi:uncharacterized membrane protein